MSALLDQLLPARDLAEALDADRKARAAKHYPAQAALTQRPTNPTMLAAWLERIPAADLLREAQAIARELALLAGYGHTAQPGAQIARVALDDAEIAVEYETDEDGDVMLLNALVNGHWIDAEDNFPATVVEQWRDAIRGDA